MKKIAEYLIIGNYFVFIALMFIMVGSVVVELFIKFTVGMLILIGILLSMILVGFIASKKGYKINWR